MQGEHQPAAAPVLVAEAAAREQQPPLEQQPLAAASTTAPARPTPAAALPGALLCSETELVVPEFSAYKSTRLESIVCRRNVRLCRDRVQTVHPDLLANEKTWYLDRSCKLEPEYADELLPEKRTVRSPGQWTVTAKLTTVTGQAQEPIDLVRAFSASRGEGWGGAVPAWRGAAHVQWSGLLCAAGLQACCGDVQVGAFVVLCAAACFFMQLC